MQCQLERATLHYDIYGEGRPIIFFHALSFDRRSMSAWMEPMFANRPGWKRIYVDLPGMGETRAEPWMKSSDDLLSVVLEFLDQIIPEERFALAGMSYGSYIARGILYHRIDDVDGICLLVPMIPATDRNMPPKSVIVSDAKLIETLNDEDKEILDRLFVVHTRPVYDRLQTEVMPGTKMADTEFLQSEFRTKGYFFRFPVDKLPHPFEKPSLFLHGRQDSIAGFAEGWNLFQQYPRATYTVLDVAGHMLPMEQPALLHVMVDNWMQRMEDES